MSIQYDEYLQEHKGNVSKAFEWMQNNLDPNLLKFTDLDLGWQINFNHDASKTTDEEYDAYDAYFYGGNKSFAVVRDFRLAWLHHIHNNPHHWQYWILNNDDPKEGEIVLDMPPQYIIEMVCDWWSFSWKIGDLSVIFPWYEERKDYMKLSDATRKDLEFLLSEIKAKLEAQ